MAALILPEPPSSFDLFGLNLTGYLAQPGSYFAVNRYGFDTGVRKFIVNTDVADLGAFVLGSPDFKYPKMYVHKITNEIIGGPWTFVDVEYLGQIYPNKPHEISTDADTRKTTVSIAFGISIVTWQIEVSEVTVQDVYITDVPPDMNVPGTLVGEQGSASGLRAPISIPFPTLESYNVSLGLPPGTIRVYTWYWILRRRAVRIAGTPSFLNSSGGPLQNVTGPGGQPLQVVVQTRTPLSGTISLTNLSKTITGVNTRFLSQLKVGNKIYATSPLYIYNSFPDANLVQNQIALEFSNGFTIASIESDTSATLTAPFSTFLLGVNFSGAFYIAGTDPFGGGGSNALYEVTDSWKRVVLVFGEPIANALSG